MTLAKAKSGRSIEAQAETEGATLLEELSLLIRRYLVLTQAQADICAVWVLHSHAFDAAEFTPYLSINSAMKRAGKSTLLDLLYLLVARPWLTGRTTPAALVRITHSDHPTLLLDETDAVFQVKSEGGESLRGLLNCGFRRGLGYTTCVISGNDWKPQKFDVFCAKAIAGIGDLPDTVADRSIPIRLKRKLKTETCDKFRTRIVQTPASHLSSRASKWAASSIDLLKKMEPLMPDELGDRQQDAYEPLVAIADLAAGQWPTRIRRALVELCAGGAEASGTEQESLFADIQVLFESSRGDRLPSHELVKNLMRDGAQWADCERGKPLTQSGLARLLRPFDIAPRDIRFGRSTLKGYYKADFEDAWSRYLPSRSGAIEATPATSQ